MTWFVKQNYLRKTRFMWKKSVLFVSTCFNLFASIFIYKKTCTDVLNFIDIKPRDTKQKKYWWIFFTARHHRSKSRIIILFWQFFIHHFIRRSYVLKLQIIPFRQRVYVPECFCFCGNLALPSCFNFLLYFLYESVTVYINVRIYIKYSDFLRNRVQTLSIPKYIKFVFGDLRQNANIR